MAEETHVGVPEAFGKCTQCGKVYPVRRINGGELWAVGTAGACVCGNDEFSSPFDP